MNQRLHHNRPDWKALNQIAFMQHGCFTSKQAKEVGFSPQVLFHNVRIGRLDHVRRGLYRIAYFPDGKNERFIAALLWSEGAGVLSHETALAVYGLIDRHPRDPWPEIQLLVPTSWRQRRLRVPHNVALAFGDLTPAERVWCGWGHVTSAARALDDCAFEGMDIAILREATDRALGRGLAHPSQLHRVLARLAFFEA
jgi:predicted transcriptional regulator of viral defense system